MTSPREIVLCHYGYDPLDRLISHALPDISKRQRFYCKSRLATEIQGAMRYSIVQHGDQLLAQQRSESEAPDTTLLATDQQRSVLQTVKAHHPPQPIAYLPYGHRPIENGLLSLLGFNGERPDPVTGHYLLGNGYRAFNPVLMRFNSPDSLSPFGNGGLNSYIYCLNDPINMGDTDGHNPFRFLGYALFKARKKFRNPFKSKNTSKGKAYKTAPDTVSMPAPSTENMGPFFKLEGMPHIQDMIMRELPGKDLAAFSQVSTRTNIMVQNAKLTPRSALGSVVDLKHVTFENQKALLKPVNSIVSGELKGVLPGDFAKTELGKITKTNVFTSDEGRFRLILFRHESYASGSSIRLT